jgi:hypothetical protein
MTTLQITQIEIAIPGEYYGGFVYDYDAEAIQSDFVAAINVVARKIVPSLTVARNGMVFCDTEDADRAREINWAEIMDEINLVPLLDLHST